MKDLNMKTLNGQSGAVLVTSLMILLVLTLLAIGSMSTSNFELIMATNFQSQTLSLTSAEIAVSEGEAYVNASYNPGPITDYIDPSAPTSAAAGLYVYDSDTKLTAGFVDPVTFQWGDPVDAANGFYTGPTGNKFVIADIGGSTTAGATSAGGRNKYPNRSPVYRWSVP